MRNLPGVYALVMTLDRQRCITIDTVRTRRIFSPGWFLYIGSARGRGGLKARTNWHRRTDRKKRKHWNVDYVRSYAPLHEIWFSHTNAKWREHAWVEAVLGMPGVRVPSFRFGASDCTYRCVSHFFHFEQQPSAALFRKILNERFCGHPAIHVEFVEPAAQPRDPLVAAYERGRRFLDRRRRASYDGLPGAVDEAALRSLAIGTPGRKLLEQVSQELGIPSQNLKKDSEFAEAVEALILNCGEDAVQAMFYTTRRRSQDGAGTESEKWVARRRKAILQLSNTADTRQRLRITGVLDGTLRSLAPQSGDSVFDTVAFREVASRLARARGAIQILGGRLTASVDPSVRAEAQRLAGLCSAAAQQLRKFLDAEAVSDADIPKRLAKAAVLPILSSRTVVGRTVGLGRLAVRLTIKSVWDYPEMVQRGILPTDSEHERAKGEIKTIIAAAKSVMNAARKPR